MDYKTALTVIILLALPTFILVIAKLISMIHQERLEQAESKSGVYVLERESAEVKFGDGESGQRASTLNDETRRSYEHGAGDSQSVDPGLTAIELFDYLEQAVTCRDPAGRELFEELLTEDDCSDDSNENSKSKAETKNIKRCRSS